MKIVYIISLVLAYTIISHPVYAQTATPKSGTSGNVTPTEKVTPSQAEKPLDSTIKSLKEKIENKVEELNKMNKKILKGTITSMKDTTINLKTEDGKDYTVTVDETITTFYSSSVAGLDEIEQADLKKGDLILVTGPLIENQISANTIYQQESYITVQGLITATDKDNFTVSFVTQNKDQYTIDIEKGTKQFMLNTKDLTLVKSGFSKFKVGDNINCVIKKPADGVQKTSAIRTLIIPQEYFSTDTPAESTITPTEEAS